jgi:hypothetical protein
MLGFQRRRVRRCEWLTDMPKPGPLPQTSQVADTKHSKKDGLVAGTRWPAGKDYQAG